MFQEQILVAKFHRITQLNLRQGMQGISTETENGLVTGFVAIPCVIFFPGLGVEFQSFSDRCTEEGL